MQLAQHWHREIYQGTRVPVPYFLGEVRDSDPRYPELVGYEVAVGLVRGASSTDVPAELARYESAMQQAVTRLDPAVAVGAPPVTGPDLAAVLTLCANAHGEWIRIHPFANGNGRTARLWVLWVTLRYGLPPFLRLKPRPEGHLYAAASAASMRGDHQPMVVLFDELLTSELRRQ